MAFGLYSFGVSRLLFYLKVSRPGLWFQTLWLYVLPVAAQRHFDSWNFWLGALFVLFPLNFLVYGWNDMVDTATDRINPRKNSFLFGAQGSAEELRELPRAMALVLIPFVLLFTVLGGWKLFAILLGMVGMIALYNLPGRGLRSRPPLELLNQLGYLLILPFSILLNRTGDFPWQSVGYLVLFCTHAHLMGEIMDVVPDRRTGRQTTATVLGIIPSKLAVAFLVLVESILILAVFRDKVMGGFLAFGVLWLLADLAVFGDRSYTRNQFLLFGIGLNAAGFASMVWIWYAGTLSRL